MKITKNPFLYLIIEAIAIFAIYAKFFASVRFAPDSPSYREFCFDSLQVVLTNIRTVGYPIFLSGVELISPDLKVLPYLQFWLYASAVFLFYFSLQTFGFTKWLAFFASAPLLFERILLEFSNFALTETLGAALAIASMGIFLMVQAKPRSKILPLILSFFVFLAYQVRPVYMFLVLLLPLLQFLIGVIRNVQGRELIRPAGVTILVLILPLTAFCSFRYFYVGHFGLVPFFGRNIAVNTTQFLTQECVEGLDPDLRRLVVETVRIRDERFGVERTKTMVPMPVAYDYWYACDPIVGEALERVYGTAIFRDNVAYDKICFKLALAIIRTRPLQVMTYYGKLFFYGISFTLYVEATIAILLIMLFVCFLAARIINRSAQFSQATQDESVISCFTILVVVGVVFYLTKLIAIIPSQFTDGRFLMAAALFLPSIISVAVAVLVSNEFNWFLLTPELPIIHNRQPTGRKTETEK